MACQGPRVAQGCWFDKQASGWWYRWESLVARRPCFMHSELAALEGDEVELYAPASATGEGSAARHESSRWNSAPASQPTPSASPWPPNERELVCDQPRCCARLARPPRRRSGARRCPAAAAVPRRCIAMALSARPGSPGNHDRAQRTRGPCPALRNAAGPPMAPGPVLYLDVVPHEGR